MLDLQPKGISKVPKHIEDMSHEEYIDFISEEYNAEQEMLDTLHDTETWCTTYANQNTIIECRKQIPKDPLWITYSLEAWSLNETVKGVIERFKKFFPKVFNYIGSFVIIRTKGAREQCQKWFNILKDQNKDQSKLDKIFGNSDVKTAKVEAVANAINSAADAYRKLSEQVNQIKGFKGVGQSDADKNKLQTMFAFPPEYQKFLDNKKLVDDATPSKEDPSGSKGFTYKDGGWDDPSKIAKIVDALDHVTSVMENIKRLQANCDEMVRSLEKEQKGEAAEQNLVKELNTEKIKFLRDFSKKVLSGMMGSIGALGSMAAANCRAFCNQYSKENE